MDAVGAQNWPTSIQGYAPIDDIVNIGRGTMDAVVLEQKYVDDIQAYLLTLAPPLSELNGQQVYDRLCIGCHGDKGEGSERGMQLRYDDLAFSKFWTRTGRAKKFN